MPSRFSGAGLDRFCKNDFGAEAVPIISEQNIGFSPFDIDLKELDGVYIIRLA